MKAHLEAIAAKLAVAYPVDVWAPDPGRVGQWAVVEAPAWAPDPDAPICSASTSFEVEVRLRVVTGTPAGAAIMLDHARSILPGALTVSGRFCSLAWVRSEFIDIDLDATIPGTNRHPAYGVDSYTLHSQPALGGTP